MKGDFRNIGKYWYSNGNFISTKNVWFRTSSCKQQSSSTRNVYVPPVQTHGEGHYPYQSPPFFGTWENPVGMGVKKKKTKGRGKGKGILLGPNSSFNSIPLLGAIL